MKPHEHVLRIWEPTFSACYIDNVGIQFSPLRKASTAASSSAFNPAARMSCKEVYMYKFGMYAYWPSSFKTTYGSPAQYLCSALFCTVRLWHLDASRITDPIHDSSIHVLEHNGFPDALAQIKEVRENVKFRSQVEKQIWAKVSVLQVQFEITDLVKFSNSYGLFNLIR